MWLICGHQHDYEHDDGPGQVALLFEILGTSSIVNRRLSQRALGAAESVLLV